MYNGMYATSRKLMKALNCNGYMLTMSTTQFIGFEGTPKTRYSLANAVWNPDTRKYENHELYGTISMVRMVLFLRDMWYSYNGWELPTDNAYWNAVRKEIRLKNEAKKE